MDELTNPVPLEIERFTLFGVRGLRVGEIFKTLLVELIDEFRKEIITHEVFTELAHRKDFVSGQEKNRPAALTIFGTSPASGLKPRSYMALSGPANGEPCQGRGVPMGRRRALVSGEPP
jgi:hypothetical protein